MFAVYLLSQDKYYIDNITYGNVNDNFQRHVDGNGGNITRMYRPILIIETIDNQNITIDEIINRYISFYGNQNVYF